MLPEQMQMCAQHFCSAVRSLINPLSLPSIEPFLAEMADALNH
jgi:hypothetical protein